VAGIPRAEFTQHSIAWEFEKPALRIQLIMGDRWLVGLVNVTIGTPAPVPAEEANAFRLPCIGTGRPPGQEPAPGPCFPFCSPLCG
jgi:hypothetical protein